jgi:hypothetical protein
MLRPLSLPRGHKTEESGLLQKQKGEEGRLSRKGSTKKHGHQGGMEKLVCITISGASID